MDGFGLMLPPPFLQSPGEPVLPWKDWKLAFETYLEASGAMDENFPAKRRIALLVHCLGSKGQRIYHSVVKSSPDVDTLTKALDLLEKQFGVKENKRLA